MVVGRRSGTAQREESEPQPPGLLRPSCYSCFQSPGCLEEELRKLFEEFGTLTEASTSTGGDAGCLITSRQHESCFRSIWYEYGSNSSNRVLSHTYVWIVCMVYCLW